jgi:hypothetical protein
VSDPISGEWCPGAELRALNRLKKYYPKRMERRASAIDETRLS